MLTEKTGIGAGLMFTMIFCAIFGYGVIQSPFIAAEYIGTGGYLTTLAVFGLSVPVILVALALNRRFPQKNIIEYLPLIFGNILGKLLGLVFLAFTLLVAALSTRLVTDAFHLYVVKNTPLIVIVLSIMLTTLYLAYQGVEVISRFSSFIFSPSIIMLVIIWGFTFQDLELSRAIPALSEEANKIPIGTLHMFNFLLPLSSLFIVLVYFTDKHKGLKTMLGATFLATLFIFLAVFITIGIFGSKGTLRYTWPLIELFRKATIPLIFQSVGLFYLAVWLIHVLVANALLYYSTAQGLASLFNRLNYKWMLLIIFPIIMTLTILPANFVMVMEFFNYIRQVGFVMVFIFPILIWMTALVLKKGVGTNGK